MKDYLWVSVSAIFSVLGLLFFVMTIHKSTTLIKKLKLSKFNVLVNLLVLIIGLVDIYFVVYLILSVREQLNIINSI